jgi:hypothetical protein
MIFTTSWVNFFPAFIRGGGGAVTVTAACGSSVSATTAGMTALVAQVAVAMSVTLGQSNNRLTVTATYGPGSSYTANEHGLWINASGYTPGFARWVAPPVTKSADQYFTADYSIDFQEVI